MFGIILKGRFLYTPFVRCFFFLKSFRSMPSETIYCYFLVVQGQGGSDLPTLQQKG